MSGLQPGDEPRMDDAFRARMRQGLSSMAVRERMRERRRNRAIAGGAVAAVVVATFAVVGAQALAGVGAERDQAAPASTQSEAPAPTVAETPPGDAPTAQPTESAAATEPAEPTPPPGLEGVAAGEPQLLDVLTCDGGCGDTGAAGGPLLERTYDVYLLCGSRGTVHFGGELWVDCGELGAGAGIALFDRMDTLEDGDPQFTTSSDFDGDLVVVDAGEPPVRQSRGAEGEGTTATVWLTCDSLTGTIAVGDSVIDCGGVEAPADGTFRGSLFAVWGVPILPGEIGPRVEVGDDAQLGSLTWVIER